VKDYGSKRLAKGDFSESVNGFKYSCLGLGKIECELGYLVEISPNAS
jgi:hypothetical protein